ncbi:MAG TPA: SDR family oxidoreductase [Anaerolineaceae bacterium]|nr:SDR family oxidoreductase [Anaerolineaceae bacterium]HPN50374.1 SDR family oxidoreductase [Anaerolineaceae bacterium]
MEQKRFWVGLGLSALALSAVIRWKRQQRARRWDLAVRSAPRRVALVTGASSGIGEAYALRLAHMGYDLILVARRLEKLHALAEHCRRGYGIQVRILTADLSTPEGIEAVEKTINESVRVDFLVNNAGYNLPGTLLHLSVPEITAMITCHDEASVRLSRAVLPGMIARGHGAIINLSSISAFLPKGGDATYCATKGYLKIFSESLAQELAGTGVSVQALCPGLTHTGFHDIPFYKESGIMERLPAVVWMEPDEVVEASLHALAVGDVVCVPGIINKAMALIGQAGLSSAMFRALNALSGSKPIL